MLKQKLVITLPIIVIAVIFVFSLTMIPSINPSPKNLPIAIVNEDQGAEVPNQGQVNRGDLIAQNLQAITSANPAQGQAIKWISVGSSDEVKAGLDNQEYYAALVIPKNFSTNQVSLRTPEPSSPQIHIYINQGMNTLASNMAGQILNQVVDGINTKLRTDLLASYDQLGGTVTTKQAAALASPIVKEVTNVNVTGANSASGNAPVSMFQPIWIGSIVGGMVFLLTRNKLIFATRKEKLRANMLQFIWGIVIALFAGYSLTWFADIWGLNIPQFNNTALFLSISFLSFFLMISAVFSWIGLSGSGIFMLFLFFGAPLLSMPPEFLSSFYQNWILSWLPMGFMVKGLREIFFFGNGLSMNHATTALVGIGLISLIVLLASSLKLSAKPKQEVELQTEI
ncbi:YhgE/Pip domain-containing protein [Cohnella abietis]|uniref:YhgE/Pip domain-containing protein n=1 Tax=Cohnella abietis TaxID=2507935 RepID=UPI00102E2EEE|nr:ABC transporter permease [Cohnella abietis]